MTKKIDNPDIHFRVPRAASDHLQETAREMDRSVSWLVAKIVMDWIASQRKPADEEVKAKGRATRH